MTFNKIFYLIFAGLGTQAVDPDLARKIQRSMIDDYLQTNAGKQHWRNEVALGHAKRALEKTWPQLFSSQQDETKLRIVVWDETKQDDTVLATFQREDFQHAGLALKVWPEVGTLMGGSYLTPRQQTLYDLKTLIQDHTGIPVRNQRIIWKGALELTDDNRTLGSYFDSSPMHQPGQEKTLYLVTRPTSSESTAPRRSVRSEPISPGLQEEAA